MSTTPFDPRFLPFDQRAVLAILQTDPSNIAGRIRVVGTTVDLAARAIVGDPIAVPAFGQLVHAGVVSIDGDDIVIPPPMRNGSNGRSAEASERAASLRGAMATALAEHHHAFTGWALDYAVERCEQGRADPVLGSCEPADAAKCLAGAVKHALAGALHCKVFEIFSNRNWPETQRRYLGRATESNSPLTVEDVRLVARYYIDTRALLKGIAEDPVTDDFRSAIFVLGRKGYKPEHFRTVIDAKVREAMKDPSKARWVNWPTMFSPKNFPKSLSMANAMRADVEQEKRARDREPSGEAASRVDNREPEWKAPCEVVEEEPREVDASALDGLVGGLAAEKSAPKAITRASVLDGEGGQ